MYFIAEFIFNQALKQSIKLPVSKPSEIQDYINNLKSNNYAKTKDNSTNAGQNWDVFDFCNQFLQTKEALREAVQDLLKRLSEKGVVYAEIRFCPTLHTLQKLSASDAVQAAIDGRSNNTI